MEKTVEKTVEMDKFENAIVLGKSTRRWLSYLLHLNSGQYLGLKLAIKFMDDHKIVIADNDNKVFPDFENIEEEWK